MEKTLLEDKNVTEDKDPNEGKNNDQNEETNKDKDINEEMHQEMPIEWRTTRYHLRDKEKNHFWRE